MNSIVPVSGENGGGLASRLRAELMGQVNRAKQDGDAMPPPPDGQASQLAREIQRSDRTTGKIVDLQL